MGSQAWQGMPLIPALSRLRPENHQSKASLGYIVTHSQKKIGGRRERTENVAKW
jgi:hypothetical protein